MNQENLFVQEHTKAGVTERPMRPLARDAEREGSAEAAAVVVESGVHASQCRGILHALARQSVEASAGPTSAELAQSMGEERHVLGRRLSDLLGVYWVKKIERGQLLVKRRCAVSGVSCVQWTVTDLGLRALRLGLPIPTVRAARKRAGEA